VAGPLVAWIVGALKGAIVVGGVSAIGAGLYSIAIPKDSIVQYETALKAGKFVLVLRGAADEGAKATKVLEQTQAAQVDLHPAMTALAQAS
jgi:hypothetical protein